MTGIEQRQRVNLIILATKLEMKLCYLPTDGDVFSGRHAKLKKAIVLVYVV